MTWKWRANALAISAILDMLSAYRGLKSRSSLEGAIQEETDAPSPTILPSSTELFYFYGQQLEQCEKYSKGETMKKLSQVFAKWLRIYAGEIHRVYPFRVRS